MRTKSVLTHWLVGTVALAALVALGGCGGRTPPESQSSTSAGDSARDVREPALEPTADSVIVALGNEPFWNVRVSAQEILYRDPEHQDGYRFPAVAAVEEGDTCVYRTRRDLPAQRGPRALELTLRRGACSDGMSDRQYPMVAVLKIGDKMLLGCARLEHRTDPSREAPP